MTMPAPHAITVLRHSVGPPDRHGRPTDTYTADPAPIYAYGITPGPADEPYRPRRELSTAEATILAPHQPGLPTDRDRVRLPSGLVYAVLGVPLDWTLGPWAHPIAGVAIEIGRADG